MSYLYQPYLNESTESLPIKDSIHGGTPSYKTVSEILSYITANNYGDSFYLSDTGYTWKGCSIIPIWADEVQDLYLGDNNLQATGGNDYPIWVKSDSCHRNSSYKSIRCIYDSLTVDSTLTGYWDTTLINGRAYYTAGAGNTSGYGKYATLYLAKDYPNIYINEQLVDRKRSGGAGSGYIGNSLLSNKKMVGYNVPTSSAESTKTESVNEASETPVSGKPKIGNGFARIKFLREHSTLSLGNLVKTLDITHKQVTGWDNSGIEDTIITQNLSSYFGTDYILVAQQNNGNYFNTFDGNEGIGYEKTINTGCAIYYPIRPIVVTKIKCSSKFDTTGSLSNDSYFELYAGYIENGSMNHITVGSHNRSKEWGIIEKEFDSPVKVEYIEFVVMDNQWHFKDVEITGVLL